MHQSVTLSSPIRSGRRLLGWVAHVENWRRRSSLRIGRKDRRAMKQALWHLLNDFLSAILFLIVYAVSGSVRIAACIAVAAGVAQLTWLKFAGRRVEPMQWTSLGLVVVLGGAAILTQNPRFV